jgi:hypothetical protein
VLDNAGFLVVGLLQEETVVLDEGIGGDGDGLGACGSRSKGEPEKSEVSRSVCQYINLTYLLILTLLK